ncbi:MAG: hypothetical protein ACI3V3_00080 [Faecousia sp.]
MTLNLTNAGLNVLLRSLAGDRIIFTRAQIGNGAAKAPATAESLSNPLLELPIQAIDVSTTNATLKTKFNNNTVEAGFRHTETGIWVQNQDDSSAEVLYAYGTQPEDTADYISASGDSILETQMDFLVFVGESQNISAIISESLVYASAADLKAHVENKDNPHAVTAKQVGLGSVPNVRTNDQTPTYTTPSTLSALASGEKLATAMGKLSRAVLSIISHLKDEKNPHEVTADQIGAAKESHKHDATDITKGILGTARGGTGKGSWTANRLIYPSAADAFSQLPFPSSDGMSLRQDKSGAPYWAKVTSSETGTYVGKGRTGSSQKNSITFSGGVPKLVIIQQKGAGTGRHAVLLPGASAPVGYSEVDGTLKDLVVSVSGNTVYWYYNSTESHPANQLDTNGETHVYAGIF